MKVEVIPNKGPASMGPEIDRSLSWAKQVDIATAFITPAAIKRLELALERAKKQKRSLIIRLLFGLYQRFTPPTALAKMLSLQREYPGKFFVHLARNKRFHWKLYVFRNGSARRFYVGSANFTNDGMMASGELCVKVAAAARDAVSKTLEAEFNRLWQDNEQAVLLDNRILKSYRKVARPPLRITNPDKDNALNSILKTPERLTLPPAAASERPKPRVCFAPHNLQKETTEIVEAETDWDRKGWSYICYPYKNVFDRAFDAKVLLFVTSRYVPDKLSLEFIRVVDKAVLDTPDGRYFIAYSRILYGWEQQYDEVKRELSQVGLTLKKLKSQISLNKVQIAVLCRRLHVRMENLLQG